MHWTGVSINQKKPQTNLIYYCQKITLNLVKHIYIYMIYIYLFLNDMCIYIYIFIYIIYISLNFIGSSIHIPFIFLTYTMSWPRSERRAKQFSPSPSSDLGLTNKQKWWWPEEEPNKRRREVVLLAKLKVFSSIYVYLCIFVVFFCSIFSVLVRGVVGKKVELCGETLQFGHYTYMCKRGRYMLICLKPSGSDSLSHLESPISTLESG